MTLLTIQEASKWAAALLKQDISPSNISYLVQYGRVRKYQLNGTTKIALKDLQKYYKSFHGQREVDWKKILGDDLNWALSFDHLHEKDTTKNVHRLHPYKGKFIPQLVEYFLDEHTDDFKKKVYFRKNDIVLDPFLGSGTTLVQAHELGMHGIGIDISQFNCVIAECKIQSYDLQTLEKAIQDMKEYLNRTEIDSHLQEFEEELISLLSAINAKYFPHPSFKYKVHRREIAEDTYARAREKECLPLYHALLKKYNIRLQSQKGTTFLDTWYVDTIRREIQETFEYIKKQSAPEIKKILAVILSRAARSCRATTHSDLATLKEPQLDIYYCYKHKKICKPLFSMRKMLERYADDTLARLQRFSALRTPALYCIIAGDSRTVDIAEAVQKTPPLASLLQKEKIRGIFSSPPYVGQIDYHEQHAYAYDLFGFPRRDASEIGPLCKGQGKQARESYIDSITTVLHNCKRYLAEDYDVFLVANDKWNLYPLIAEKTDMQIVQRFKRPVLNRTERDRNPYSETIFHLKQKV
ncbi:site-specific DNA-methyltransferase [Candidatus Peregrinibacteria bacterium]|nr:site-specific DNA-methyltransferase [Candidatus Peregrinibacteria bacterium]